MVPSSTFIRSNAPGEYAPWMVTTITGGEQVPQEKLLQLIEAPSLTTSAFWTTTNTPANPTIANPYIIFQCTPNYERYIISAECTSGESFVSFSDLSSLKWTTETHNRTRYFPCGLLFRSLGYPVVQFIS